MKIFKGYTKNHYRSKTSIIKRYITEKALKFCSNYLSETESTRIPKSLHANKYGGRSTQGLNVK